MSKTNIEQGKRELQLDNQVGEIIRGPISLVQDEPRIIEKKHYVERDRNGEKAERGN